MLRNPLPLNTPVILKLFSQQADSSHVSFIPEQFLGCGGNSLAYTGRLTRGNEPPVFGLMKEFLPVGLASRDTAKPGHPSPFSPIRIASKSIFDVQRNLLHENYLDSCKYADQDIADILPPLLGIFEGPYNPNYQGETTSYFFSSLTVGDCDYGAFHETSLFPMVQRIHGLCNRVARLHQRGLIHLDIKPENIIPLKNFDNQLALIDTDSLTSSTLDPAHIRFTSYSAGFSSPEQKRQASADIGPWSDVYALGAILYQKLYNRLPYAHRSLRLSVPYEISNPLFSGMSRATYHVLSGILKKALSIPVFSRFQSAAELASHLEKLLISIQEDSSPKSLYEHLSASLELSSNPEIAASYINHMLETSPELLRPVSVDSCLIQIRESMLYPQRFTAIRYVCQVLLDIVPDTPANHSEQALAHQNHRRIILYLLTACSALGDTAREKELLEKYPDQKSFQEFAPDHLLRQAEFCIEHFRFQEASALLLPYQDSMKTLCTLLPCERNQLTLAKLYSKSGQIHSYLNDWEAADAAFCCALESAEALSSPVHALTISTYYLYSAASLGSQADYCRVFRFFADNLRHSSGIDLLSAEDSVSSQFEMLLSLEPVSPDYQKPYLLQVFLHLFLRKCKDGHWNKKLLCQALDICALYSTWVSSSQGSSMLSRHPGELIAKDIALLAAHTGQCSLLDQCVHTLESYCRESSLLTLISLFALLEIANESNRETTACIKRICACLSAFASDDDQPQRRVIQDRFAPFSNSNNIDIPTCLNCLSYNYR